MRRRMVCLLVLLTGVTVVTAQSRRERLNRLFEYVSSMDSFSLRSQNTFYLEKFEREDTFRETWRYSELDGRVVFFQVSFFRGPVEFNEVYYLEKGRLVCSEEYETVNHHLAEEELRRGGILYFNGTSAEHVVMVGMPAVRMPSLPYETTVFSRFQKRYLELKRHLPMLPTAMHR